MARWSRPGCYRRVRRGLLREASEEAVGIPARLLRAVGGVPHEVEEDLVPERGRLMVDGLVEVVRWSVVPLVTERLESLLGRRARHEPRHERERRNAGADQVVLVAPDEEIALRLGVLLRRHAVTLGHLGRARTEGRLV